MHDVEASEVSFSVDDDSNSADVISSGDVAEILDFEFDVVDDLAGCQVDFDSVMDVNFWVGVSDGSCVVSDNVRDFVRADFLLDDSADLGFGFFGLDWDEGEFAFDIVHDPVMFIGLVDGNDVHHSGGEAVVSSDLSVDFHVAVLVV